ncbi:MAG: DUF6477 family protein [Pseudomonadota bacterium]
MTDLLQTLSTLKRPRLLINAARIGTADYRRTPHLERHLGDLSNLTHDTALRLLMDIELDLNAQRESRMAAYSVARHVEVLIAMMHEARCLRDATSPAPAPA